LWVSGLAIALIVAGERLFMRSHTDDDGHMAMGNDLPHTREPHD
jgi:hypothetical protein